MGERGFVWDDDGGVDSGILSTVVDGGVHVDGFCGDIVLPITTEADGVKNEIVGAVVHRHT